MENCSISNGFRKWCDRRINDSIDSKLLLNVEVLSYFVYAFFQQMQYFEVHVCVFWKWITLALICLFSRTHLLKDVNRLSSTMSTLWLTYAANMLFPGWSVPNHLFTNHTLLSYMSFLSNNKSFSCPTFFHTHPLHHH